MLHLDNDAFVQKTQQIIQHCTEKILQGWEIDGEPLRSVNFLMQSAIEECSNFTKILSKSL